MGFGVDPLVSGRFHLVGIWAVSLKSGAAVTFLVDIPGSF